MRKQAEEIARGKAALLPENIERMSPAEIKRTLQDLQAQQFDLELQNEELRRAQEEMDAAGTRFFDFYDLAPVGYFTLNEKGLILEANLIAATMLGVVRRKLVKQPLSNFILPKDKDIHYLQHKHLVEATSASSRQAAQTQMYEIRMVKEDGSIFWVRLDTIALRNTNGAPMCRIVMSDITDNKLREHALEKTRKELVIIKKTADDVSEFAESIINAVREPLIYLDQNLRVVNASRSFYEFFRVRPGDTVGQLIYDLGNKQWDIPKLRELLETILPEKTTFDNYEVEHDFTTIGKRIMLLNARQIQQVLGKEKIILLAIEDITERKEIEVGLEKAHEELQEC